MNENQFPTTGIPQERKSTANIKRLRRRRLFVYLALSLLIPAVYFIWKVTTIAGFAIYGLQPPEMALAQYTPRDVVGDLGGMKVRIPRYYAEYVEYDGDPGFGEKRKGPHLERTSDSRLRSFGMNVRFPDMKGLVDREAREEKRLQPLRERTWIYVGVIAGQHYPGDGFLDRRTQSILAPSDYWWNQYRRLPDDIHGLQVYVVAGTDPHTGGPARESPDTKDVYIHRRGSGEVDAIIDCNRSRVSGGVASCDMEFSLTPKAHVEVSVDFRRDLLPEWQLIRQSVHDLLLSFETTKTSETNTKSAPNIPHK